MPTTASPVHATQAIPPARLLYSLLLLLVLYALAETALRVRAKVLGRSENPGYGKTLHGAPTAFLPHPLLQYVLNPAIPGTTRSAFAARRSRS